jgi:hypothetical protein
MEHRWNETDRENRSTRGKTYPSATLCTTNPTWTNPGLRGGRPATNRLSHGMAQIALYKYLKSSRETSFILESKITIRRQRRTADNVCGVHREGKLSFHGMYVGEIDCTIVLFSAETLFQIQRYWNS